MALEVGNLLNAAAGLASTISNSSLKSFLANLNNFGIQVKNNFEINFSAIPDVKIFVQSIQLPEFQSNYTEINFEGRKIDIPTVYDYSHTFSMTVINDAQGYIYNELMKFIKNEAFNINLNTNHIMRVRAMTGDELNYGGSLITMYGIRLETISGLDFSYSDNDIQTFNISGKCMNFEITPGVLGGVANVLGSINGII